MAALEARSSMTRETIRSPDGRYPNRVGDIVRTVGDLQLVGVAGMHWNPQTGHFDRPASENGIEEEDAPLVMGEGDGTGATHDIAQVA